MWDKWLAALMKAHKQAPRRAMTTDECWGYHRPETLQNNGPSQLNNGPND